MSHRDREAVAKTSFESEKRVTDSVGEGMVSRRAFLAGVGIGTICGGGVTLGLSQTATGSGQQNRGTTAPLDVQYVLPGVDATGSGLIVGISFEFADGNGELFVNLNGIEMRHDLQRALIEAMKMATGFTGRSLEHTATHVSFEPSNTNRVALRGKSWEAGLTVALIAGLRRQPLSAETLITGIVSDDGQLLPVGEIAAKARSAQAFGATQLVVPSDVDADSTVEGLHVIPVQSIAEAVDTVVR